MGKIYDSRKRIEFEFDLTADEQMALLKGDDTILEPETDDLDSVVRSSINNMMFVMDKNEGFTIEVDDDDDEDDDDESLNDVIAVTLSEDSKAQKRIPYTKPVVYNMDKPSSNTKPPYKNIEISYLQYHRILNITDGHKSISICIDSLHQLEQDHPILTDYETIISYTKTAMRMLLRVFRPFITDPLSDMNTKFLSGVSKYDTDKIQIVLDNVEIDDVVSKVCRLYYIDDSSMNEFNKVLELCMNEERIISFLYALLSYAQCPFISYPEEISNLPKLNNDTRYSFLLSLDYVSFTTDGRCCSIDEDINRDDQRDVVDIFSIYKTSIGGINVSPFPLLDLDDDDDEEDLDEDDIEELEDEIEELNDELEESISDVIETTNRVFIPVHRKYES